MSEETQKRKAHNSRNKKDNTFCESIQPKGTYHSCNTHSDAVTHSKAFQDTAAYLHRTRVEKQTQRYISFDVALKTLSVCVATVRPRFELIHCPICRGFGVDIDHWETFDVPTFLGRTIKLNKCSMLTAVCLLQDFLHQITSISSWWNSVLRDSSTKILIETQGRFGERQRVLSYVLGAELYRRYGRKESHIQYVNATLKNTDQHNEWLDRVSIPRRPTAASRHKRKKNNKSVSNEKTLTQEIADEFELPSIDPPVSSSNSSESPQDTTRSDPYDVFGIVSTRKEQLSRNKRYAERKRAAVKAALILLKQCGLTDWLSYFLQETVSKRDDYADALTQLFYYHLREHKQVLGSTQQKKQRRQQNQQETKQTTTKTNAAKPSAPTKRNRSSHQTSSSESSSTTKARRTKASV